VSKSTAPRGLYTPRTSRRYSPRLDPETVGQFTESIARFFGTGRYLLLQTVLVLVWIALNLFAVDTEYLARELAAVRLAVGEVATREYLRHELDGLREILAKLRPETAAGDTVSGGDALERTVKKSR
jgi:uncharacterized membrane protein